MSTRRQFLKQTTASFMAAASATTFAAADQYSTSSKPSLRTYKIPNTNITVPRLGYGTLMWGSSSDEHKRLDETVSVIRVAYEQGIRLFDFSDAYGNETAMSRVLKDTPELRNQIVIQTKCGTTPFPVPVFDNSREHLLRSVDGSLARLGVDHIDIFLFHFPDNLVEPEEVAEAFETLHANGKVRYFGVANHGPAQIEILKKYVRQPIVVNQIHLGMAHWYTAGDPGDPDKLVLMHGREGVPIVDYCWIHDIQVQAYGSFRAGYMSANSPNLLKPAPDASPEVKHAAQLLAEVARKYDTTPAVIMLAWLLRHPAKIMPILGGYKPEYIIENCMADRITLTREEWYSLLWAGAHIQPL